MKIKIVYFGLIVDAIGIQSEWIEQNDISGNLSVFFEKKYPELKRLKYKIAVDGEFSDTIQENSTTKEIALLPPFAGG